MLELKSPENYNELLEQLNKITFVSTFLFLVFMTVYGYIPVIKISENLVPQGKDEDIWLKWIISFGLVPVTFSFVAFLASFSLEMHNLISKWIGLRCYWDRKITKKALEISQVQRKVTCSMTRAFMEREYYDGVKGIEQHYVKLFWRYTLSFWAIFEHFFIAAITVLYLYLSSKATIDSVLLFYLLGVLIFLLFSFFVVVLPKSYAQVRKLDKDKLTAFFKDYP